MNLNQMLQNDAALFLADFGELVTYYPRGKAPRQITALVDRNPPVRFGGDGSPLIPAIQILVTNSDATGIASASVDGRGADQVELPIRLGGPLKRMGVYMVGEGMQSIHDPGMCHYELR